MPEIYIKHKQPDLIYTSFSAITECDLQGRLQ